MMRVVAMAILEVLFLEPQVFGDGRGFFMKAVNIWNDADIGIRWAPSVKDAAALPLQGAPVRRTE